MARATLLGSWPGLRVVDLACEAGRSGPSVSRGGEATHLVLLRRGSFAYHLGCRTFLGDARAALLHRSRHEYRISHPGHGGDESTVFELDDELTGQLFASAPTELHIGAGATVALHRLRTALGRGTAAEDGVLGFLRALSAAPPEPTPSRRELLLARRARERIEARLDENLGARALAATLGISPFTLMHAFRRVTGVTLRRYRIELRLAAALSRLEDGGRDLSRLAVELGFSHHSHLTASFRRLYGAAPRALVARS